MYIHGILGEVDKLHCSHLNISDTATHRIQKYAFISRIASLSSVELFKMVCGQNESDVNISIPVVMLPQDAGMNLENDIKNNSRGMILPLCL